MKTTGEISAKRYRCVHCNTESTITTNHYGEVYSQCENWLCVSRRPVMNGTYKPPRHTCLEPLPEGWDQPPPWKETSI